MKKLIFAVVISLAVGFAAASWMETTLVSTDVQSIEQSSVSAFDSAAPVEERIRALEQAVIQEQQARQWLEEEIYVLREEIEQRNIDAVDLEVQDMEVRRESSGAFRSRRFGVSSTEGQLDRLVAAGFPPDQAQWIVDREAEIQMERLQVRYKAMRSSG